MTSIELYTDLLFKKYNKTQLSKKEMASVLEISISTLDNLISKNDLPIKYQRIGKTQKARFVFPLLEIANFLAFQEAA